MNDDNDWKIIIICMMIMIELIIICMMIMIEFDNIMYDDYEWMIIIWMMIMFDKDDDL